MVNHLLAADALQARTIEEVPLDEAEPWMVPQGSNVLDLSAAEIVENSNFFTASQKRRRKIRPDATRASSDKCLHACGNGSPENTAEMLFAIPNKILPILTNRRKQGAGATQRPLSGWTLLNGQAMSLWIGAPTYFCFPQRQFAGRSVPEIHSVSTEFPRNAGPAFDFDLGKRRFHDGCSTKR